MKQKYWIGIIVGIVVIYLIFNISDPQETTENLKDNELEDSFSVKEMHFTEMPITYSINLSSQGGYWEAYSVWNHDGNSRIQKLERIKDALKTIEEETGGLITFKEVNTTDNPKIEIQGYYDGEGLYGDSDGWDILGIGEIINSEKNEIYSTKVTFFSDFWGTYTGRCIEYPLTEVHEILHVFGFGHVFDNNAQIMYPLKLSIESCKINKIDQETINCLKHIYSNGEIEGDCSKLNIFPYRIEDEINKSIETFTYEDLLWETYPVTYSIIGCEDYVIKEINNVVKSIEPNAYQDLLTYRSLDNSSKIKFYCKKKEDEKKETFSYETDFWSDGTPAINKKYILNDDGKLMVAEINLFNYEKCMSENYYDFVVVSLDAVLRSLGIRDYETYLSKGNKWIYCNEGSIDDFVLERIRNL